MPKMKIPSSVHFISFANQPKDSKLGPKWLCLSKNDPYQKQYCSTLLDEAHIVYAPVSETKYKNSRGGLKVCRANNPTQLKLVGYRSISKRTAGRNDLGYKLIVATPDNFCFPIENDVFIDAVQNGGVAPNGTLPGEYIFVKISQKILAVRRNSDLHKAALEQGKFNKIEPIDTTKLQVGGVYVESSGAAALFLGYVSTKKTNIFTEGKKVSAHWPKFRSMYARNDNYYRHMENQTIKLGTLWLKLTNIYALNSTKLTVPVVEQIFANCITQITNNPDRLNASFFKMFRVNKVHNYNRLFLNETVELPSDIIMQVRRLYERAIGSVDVTNVSYINYGRDIRLGKERILWALSKYSEIINMVPFGADVVQSSLYDKMKIKEK